MSLSKLTAKEIVGKLPKRPRDAHKGTFGKVLVIAGSENYPGAAYLACAACYRVGAGLVTLATDQTTKIIVSRKLPEVTFLLRDEVFDKLPEYDVLLLGPGLGLKEQTIKFIKQLLLKKLPKTVIDGDGLNILSKIDGWWKTLQADAILTPHAGEMARLTEVTVDQIQADRIIMAKRFAKMWNEIVVLKGANTVVVSPAGEVKLAQFANPALATAGTGDVLSGTVAGLAAQGLNLFDASCVGVYIHGLAGEMVRRKLGEAGALASDLLPCLPQVLKQLKQMLK